MSTYVWMRILESAPRRYQLGVRLLTLGRLERIYDRLAKYVEPGHRVLDLGCGTGALTLRAAARGARVVGVDVSPEMLEVARRRAAEQGLRESVELREMGVAELDGEADESYDVVMSGLCFSELSEDEIAFTLEAVRRILKPGGLLILADEVRPRRRIARWIHALLRAPLAALTYLVSGRTTHPVDGLAERVEASGLRIEPVRESFLGSFIELVAQRPKESTA